MKLKCDVAYLSDTSSTVIAIQNRYVWMDYIRKVHRYSGVHAIHSKSGTETTIALE